MLITNPIALSEYRHDYLRLASLVGTLVLFIGHIVVNQLSERGNNLLFPNITLRAEEVSVNDITPSDWIYRALDAFNYFWQLAWLLYCLTFIYRRTSTGYLYISPKTFTPTLFAVYTLGFFIQTIWLIFFNDNHIIWTWVIYLLSFILLSSALFIINHNLSINKKIYETEGLTRDVWFLRFFAQNGIAFFACWTGLRFVLGLNTFLQLKCDLSIANSGTICLILAGLLACAFFIVPNLNAKLVDQCAYQFSPWIVFIIFFWGVVENNWIPKNATRNNIIAAIELIASIVSAVAALVLFAMRYRASKIDPIV